MKQVLRPGTEPAALASAVSTPAPASPATPPYILIAAAGGARLGGVFLRGKMIGKKGKGWRGEASYTQFPSNASKTFYEALLDHRGDNVHGVACFCSSTNGQC